jgi:hypothetical protein
MGDYQAAARTFIRVAVALFVLALVLAVASTAMADTQFRTPFAESGFCNPPSNPPSAPAPPPFVFPDEPDVDVDVTPLPPADTPVDASQDWTLASILSAVAALAGGVSGYVAMKDSEDADDENIPLPDEVPKAV